MKEYELTKKDDLCIISIFDESNEYREVFERVFVLNLKLFFILKKDYKGKLKNLKRNVRIYYKDRGFTKVKFLKYK